MAHKGNGAGTEDLLRSVWSQLGTQQELDKVQPLGGRGNPDDFCKCESEMRTSECRGKSRTLASKQTNKQNLIRVEFTLPCESSFSPILFKLESKMLLYSLVLPLSNDGKSHPSSSLRNKLLVLHHDEQMCMIKNLPRI